MKGRAIIRCGMELGQRIVIEDVGILGTGHFRRSRGGWSAWPSGFFTGWIPPYMAVGVTESAYMGAPRALAPLRASVLRSWTAGEQPHAAISCLHARLHVERQPRPHFAWLSRRNATSPAKNLACETHHAPFVLLDLTSQLLQYLVHDQHAAGVYLVSAPPTPTRHSTTSAIHGHPHRLPLRPRHAWTTTRGISVSQMPSNGSK